MTRQNSDLTFFTNDENGTLLDRFKATLADTRLFDVLVGYFRSSGFYQLYDSIEPVEKTRILVGLGIDEDSTRAVTDYRSQSVLDFESHQSAKTQFQETLIEEIEHSEESDDKLELGLKKFIQFKAANKEIFPHLGEFEPLTDTMSEEEKLAIIQREFDRLYDPNHPVRNNLETLDSVEVVRIIREALKR